jgi:hypothetical protein
MGRYSFVVYGTANLKYGQIENNRAYYNASLKAISLTYGSVYVSWSSVLTDPEKELSPGVPATITHWKLVRSFSGNSDNPYDGTVVDGGTISNYRTSAIDGPLRGNSQVTYTLWVFDQLDWINCGVVSAVVVEESATPTLTKIQKWLPAAWLNFQGDEVGEADDDDLTRVLSGYAFAYDKLRTEARLLETVSDYRYLPVQLLRTKLEERGFTYEPVLGDSYHRSLYRVSETINATKGTKQAIASYVTALTHWVPVVEVGKNLLLNYNDSSFEESVGNWTTSVGNFSAVTYNNSLSTVGVALLPPSPTVFYNPGFSPRSVGFGWIHGHNTSPVLNLPSTSANKVLYGVPVNPLTRYRFTGWLRIKDSSKTGSIAAKINWYDKVGTLISSTTNGTALTGTTTWQEFASKSDSGINGQLSPETAAYASITLTFTNNNNQVEYFIDMLQLSVADGTTTFEDARKILIYVAGDKTNLIHNPSFENDTSFWTAHDGTLTRVTTPAYAIHRGSYAAKFVASSTDRAGIVSDWIPVQSGQAYTFSAYVSAPPTEEITARIEFSSLQSAEDQSTILFDEDGEYYPTDSYYVDVIQEQVSDSLTRIEVTAVAPTYVIDAGTPSAKVSLFLTNPEIGDIFYVDGIQLERSGVDSTYFDGDGANIPPDPINEEVIEQADCKWENDATSNGRSYRWTNYAAKAARLVDTLSSVLPYASSWELRPGLPTPVFPELTPSVLKSPSFERSTEGWVTDSSILTRAIFRGSVFDEYPTNGVAFGKVQSTVSNTFGIHSEIALINTLSGYYGSVAIKPENEDGFGTYTLTTRFYDASNVLLTSKSKTIQINTLSRWAYIAVYAQKSEIYGASKADIKIECTPLTPATGIVFDIDRVVFRQ